jgi:hypothetical protein
MQTLIMARENEQDNGQVEKSKRKRGLKYKTELLKILEID